MYYDYIFNMYIMIIFFQVERMSMFLVTVKNFGSWQNVSLIWILE